MIKTIETYYRGITFRSRTEARWAVFFDTIGVKWEYEYEGFLLEGGEKYLPDFWFPELKFFAEVKPHEFERADFKRWKNFCAQNNCELLMLYGAPNMLTTYKICGSSTSLSYEGCSIVTPLWGNHPKYGLWWHGTACEPGKDEGWNNYYLKQIQKAKNERFTKCQSTTLPTAPLASRYSRPTSAVQSLLPL